jgi:excinuclease ABC subunit B
MPIPFRLESKYAPTGDQPDAIAKLMASIDSGEQYQTLLGVTGSGKTFTMANIIARSQRPALIMAHNKTLAAQLAQEFKEFFPDNAVHYFVSYYDYYQPEAFVVKSGSYIEKEATINEEIDRLRHAATESLLTRKDVIIVASVSCIYGIGEVDEYEKQCLKFKVNEEYPLEALIASLVNLQFKRSTADFKPGMFHVLGDTLEIWPSSSEEIYRLEFFGDTLEQISRTEHLTHRVFEYRDELVVFPAKHFVTSKSVIDDVIPKIRAEMESQVEYFQNAGKLVEAERIKMRVEYDMEMLSEVGSVNGIENYSMYLGNRNV